MLSSQCHFVGPPLELMGPLKPTAFLRPIVPLKSMGPGVIVPPAPPPPGGPAWGQVYTVQVFPRPCEASNYIRKRIRKLIKQ